jgi:hypothetical protein
MVQPGERQCTVNPDVDQDQGERYVMFTAGRYQSSGTDQVGWKHRPIERQPAMELMWTS